MHIYIYIYIIIHIYIYIARCRSWATCPVSATSWAPGRASRNQQLGGFQRWIPLVDLLDLLVDLLDSNGIIDGFF